MENIPFDQSRVLELNFKLPYRLNFPVLERNLMKNTSNFIVSAEKYFRFYIARELYQAE